MEKFRQFTTRLLEFVELREYVLIADEIDYIVFEDSTGYRFQCSGHSVHLAMVEAGIV